MPLRDGWPEGGERVRDLEPPRAEAVDLGGPAAGASGPAPFARRLEDVAPEQHSLQVRGRDVVAQRGGVDVAQLRERECRRREQIGRAHVCTPLTLSARMPTSASKR